jgi:hypothetical protein
MMHEQMEKFRRFFENEMSYIEWFVVLETYDDALLEA